VVHGLPVYDEGDERGRLDARHHVYEQLLVEWFAGVV
jgi:hypothetical protein